MTLLLLLCLLGDGPVINLGPAFGEFWKAAAGRPVAEQRALWQERVEGPQQAVYDALVWRGTTGTTAREERLDRSLERLPPLAPEMTRLFTEFEPTLQQQCARFQQAFPEFRRDVPVYALPSVGRFNGKSGMVKGQLVLAFGMDQIVARHDNPDVLYAHELFHVYHLQRLGLTEREILQAPLALSLWLEGLASYVSHQLNPQAPLADVLMDAELPRVSAEDCHWLAERFQQWSATPMLDRRGQEVWFQVGGRLRPDLPSRCGYLLGYLVAEKLARGHSLDELARWPLPVVVERVAEALQNI